MGKMIIKKDSSVTKVTQESKKLIGVVESYHVDTIKDLKKLNTDFVVGVAKAVMDMTKKIADDNEFSKQYELGKIFNASALAVKSGNKKVRIKDIQNSIGFNQRTWNFYVEFYINHTKFKEMLSLGADPKIHLPKYTANRNLRGNDSEDMLQNWKNIVEFYGDDDEVKSSQVKKFNDDAKNISSEVWTVTADEMREYLAEEEEEPEPTEPKKPKFDSTPKLEGYAGLSINDKNRVKNEYYLELHGIDVHETWDDFEVDLDDGVPDELTDILMDMSQKEWKTMFRKGALQFNSDTGKGTDLEARVWKTFALLVERAFNNLDVIAESERIDKLKNEMENLDDNVVAEWYDKKDR